MLKTNDDTMLSGFSYLQNIGNSTCLVVRIRRSDYYKAFSTVLGTLKCCIKGYCHYKRMARLVKF